MNSPKEITLDNFTEALYDAGWDAPCDAQHEKIKEVFYHFANAGKPIKGEPDRRQME